MYQRNSCRARGRPLILEVEDRPKTKPAITIEPLTGRRTLGQGARSIEIIDVSPTSHAASMLAAYVPSERLLFQADLLRVNQHGGVVMSPDATRDLACVSPADPMSGRSEVR